MEKRDYKNILILLLFALVFIFSIFMFGTIFGANMDWINQHTVIPEYFRNYFYETGKLIPDIIYNLGLGENAFNFSYYGLFNPVILISYLFPFINMTTYIVASSIALYLLSIYLFYRFLKSKFDIKLTTLLTIIFMCASPILFQFHRQIMFVNYLPFLIMALINVDNFEKTNSKIFLILNILSMILTSYYFSVGGLLVILIYYIYLNFNKAIHEKLKIFIPIIISILMSGVILIPSLIAILNSRSGTVASPNLLNLFIPNFNYSDVLYSSYALGLSSIAIISVFYLILKKEKSYKFLGIALLVLLTFPIFRYLLNGGLYVRSKVLIPLIPIIIFSIGIFLIDLFNNKIDFKKLLIGISVLAILGLLNFNLAYYLDLIATTIFLYLYYKFKHKYIIVVPLIILAVITVVTSNLDENYITYSEYKNLNVNKAVVDNITNHDNSFYRISELDNTLYNVNRNFSHLHYKTSVYSSNTNPYYKDFYYNILNVNNNNYNNLIIRDTDNIIFNRLTAVKYVLSEDELGYGYSKLINNVYQNDYSLSLGYASSNTYSVDKFNNLGYPYNLKYLLNGIVIEGENNNETEDIIKQYHFDLIEELNKFVDINKQNHSHYISLDSEQEFKIMLDGTLENQVLFITINGLESNDCSNEDISIMINGQENSLSCTSWLYHNQNYTFDYLINEKNLNKLEITMKKGNYKIDSIDLYTMDVKYLDNYFDEMTDVEIVDNEISGNINVSDDGYMSLSIPYDAAFRVFVDDEQVQIEKVNTAFIGFKINEGRHRIRIVYETMGLSAGKFLSIVGLLLFVTYSVLLLKRRNIFVKIK